MKDNKKIEKLVRNKIPELIAVNGERYNVSVLSDKEYLLALKKKIIEEANEVNIADNNKKMIEENGDLLDVIDATINAYGLSMEDVLVSRKLKNEKYGDFSKKIFLHDILIKK